MKDEFAEEPTERWLEDMFNYLFHSDFQLKRIFDNRDAVTKYFVERERTLHSHLSWIIHEHFDGEIVIDVDDIVKYTWRIEEKKNDDGTTMIRIKRTLIPDD